MQPNNKIDTWIFDLDNTLYSADSGIFQQVEKLMRKFIVEHLKVNINEAKNIQRRYYKQHGTTLRGLMDNHGIDPDFFLDSVHDLDYSIINPNKKLNKALLNLKGRKIIYTNANRKHADMVLDRLEITDMFEEIIDIKMMDYIPKPEIEPYKEIINKFNISPDSTIMFDDIAKNLVPASMLGFITVWIDLGYENFSDDVANSKDYLNYKTSDLPNWLSKVNTEIT